MVTLEDALNYMGVDYADDVARANAARAMRTAESTMRGAVGERVREYLPDDPRVDEIVLIYTDDLYSERGVSAKVSAATRRMVSDMEQQLRLELRSAMEAGGSA